MGISSGQRPRGKTDIADRWTFVKAKVQLPFCFLSCSSAQDWEHSAKWTKHHSIHLFCCWPYTLETPWKRWCCGTSSA